MDEDLLLASDALAMEDTSYKDKEKARKNSDKKMRKIERFHLKNTE
jgi:hypothetical protein